MYKNIKRIGDFFRSWGTRYKVKIIGQDVYVSKGDITSVIFPRRETGFEVKDIYGLRGKYNHRFVRKLENAISNAENKGVELKKLHILTDGSAHTGRAIENLLKGRTYKPPEHRFLTGESVKTLKQRKQLTQKLGKLKAALPLAAFTGFLTFAARDGGPNAPEYVESFKNYLQIGAGATTALLLGSGIAGLYHSHEHENLETLDNLRKKARDMDLILDR